MKTKILRCQYRLEKKYHNLLIAEKNLTKRMTLYRRAYDDIYAFFGKYCPSKKQFGYLGKSFLLYEFIITDKIGIDYGCGYGSFCKNAASLSLEIYGLDASKEIIKKNRHKNNKKNIFFKHTSSMKLPFKPSSVDFIYSTGVLEHLHPEDALEHLKEAFKCLKRGGYYILITPNRIFGPSDVSKFFLKRGAKARGLHLQEYTYSSLGDLLSQVGFRDVKSPLFLEYILIATGLSKLFKHILVDIKLKIFFEKYLSFLPKFLAEILRIRGISLIIKK